MPFSQTPPTAAGLPASPAADDEGLDALFESQDVDASDITAALAAGTGGGARHDSDLDDEEGDAGDGDAGDAGDAGDDAAAEEAAMGLALGELPDIVGTEHADDAVDYESEDSLAEEEEEDDLPGQQQQPGERDQGQGDEDEDDWMKDIGDEAGEVVTDDEINVKREPGDDGDLNVDDLFKTNIPPPDTSTQSTYQQPPDTTYAPTPETSSQTQQPMSYQPPQPADLAPPIPVLTEEEARAKADEMLFEDMARMEESKPVRMSYLFASEAVKLMLPKPATVSQCVPTRANLDADKDQRKLFGSHIRIRGSLLDRPGTVQIDLKDSNSRKRRSQKRTSAPLERRLTKEEEELLFACYDWESKVIWDIDSDSEMENGAADLATKKLKTTTINTSVDDDIYWIDEEDYIDGIDDEAILEGNLDELANRVVLDLNDPQLLVYTAQRRDYPKRELRTTAMREELFQKRYNVSNDQAYDLLKENYQSRVRATVGNLTIDHAMPALRLQSPYYKVKLSKSQARSFHRPNLVVRPNTVIHFSKMRHRKKKKDRGKDLHEILATSNDLSLCDGCNFVLLEYAEEHPIIMSNYGMGSKILNYYRKKNDEDESRPKLSIGEAYVLNSQDRSPFWNFGFVDPGETAPTLYNRLVRAPLYKHEPYKTDFLMIRGTGGGNPGQKYFLRTIPHLFTVGQTFPVTEVPSPRSRRVTTASKNRLKMIVYRVLHKSDKERILVKGISQHFPDQNDMQNRQRLKEFMEYQRTGEDQGFWKIKPTDTLPNEDGIRGMVTPEEITLLETMQVSQQFLEDQGYGGGKDDDEQHEGMSTEEKLAPWITSKNFINATQGKAMLELHGEGDPTGTGLGFSFIRTSMKGGFKAAAGSVAEQPVDKSKLGGHSYNVALQQKAYEEEIRRIWNAQKADLSAAK